MNHCRCCSKLEEIALSPRVGRLFIIIAITLITIGTITYFNVIFPTTLNTPSSLLFSIYLTICTTTHYYWACTTHPGSPATEPPPPPHHHLIQRHCPKCLKRGITPPLKPERAHHCRHCGQCQLKYDHHCPWINQCVGLRNERFFLLFLFYLSISCAWIVYWGWPCFTDTFDFATPWPFWSPRIFMILTWVLALAIGVAIAIMFGWQLWLVAKGETTVESSDNEYYRTLFSQRGQVSKQLSNPVLKERRETRLRERGGCRSTFTHTT